MPPHSKQDLSLLTSGSPLQCSYTPVRCLDESPPTMHISDLLAHSQEFLVFLDRCFELPQIVEQHAFAVIRSAFVSALPGPLAREC